ncbi:protein of unknown function [Candidatus Methylomirabilis oxygeniifera]|uniref:Uncharacterized protein n=1 Tax=Methylomirabilis oxygeniifera TaxID=671143 RepID=D5MIS9_METO1|nr:protein of unknown function [Candidatus Methylomirabilis oxyfera]
MSWGPFERAGVFPGGEEFFRGGALVIPSYGTPFLSFGVCDLSNDGRGIDRKRSLPISGKLS